MAKGKPTTSALNLFDFDALPELDNATLAAAGAELAEAAERSRALREDLVFPATEEPATVIDVDMIVSDGHAVTAHIPGFESMAPETQKALGDVVQSVVALAQEVLDTSSRQAAGHAKAADSFAMGRLEDQWPHVYAFVAQARKHGLTDPALTPVQVSPAGRREFDLAELARYANELLRGVRSIKPEMKPERWAQASAKAREMGGKS